MDFLLENENQFSNWISKVITSEGKKEGEINYVFCDDSYLLEINNKYLQHDFYTDIISFDYTIGEEINGDIFISIERVRENAVNYRVAFEEELKRVMIHGILHYCGYSDKSPKLEKEMRLIEDKKMDMFL